MIACVTTKIFIIYLIIVLQLLVKNLHLPQKYLFIPDADVDITITLDINTSTIYSKFNSVIFLRIVSLEIMIIK